MLHVRRAVLADADDLAPRLREADLQEIQAVSGETPSQALRRCITASELCYTALDASRTPVAVFGVVPDAGEDEAGIVWLVGSPALSENRFPFLRLCRRWVAHLECRYRILWNYVDARNLTHLRWLNWCGFMLLERVESYGREGRPFWEFRKIRAEDPRHSASAERT